MELTAEHQRVLEAFRATGRNHPYYAFTLNGICDLDCVFCKPHCMPDYGHKDKLLSVDEFTALAAAGGRWGLRKAHCSGGEPTLRKDILGVVRALADGLGDGAQIGMTTHGNLRRGLSMPAFAEAGLTYLNVSIHSLDPARSRKIMGGGDPYVSMATVEEALKLGLRVKLNCVLMRSYVEDAFAVASIARTLPVAVRLIELQNIGPAQEFFDEEFVPEAEVRTLLSDWFTGAGEVSRTSLGVRSPGQYSQPEGWKGSIGFISNSSCATCSDANRIKVTASGVARPCILHNRDIQLRPHIAGGTLDDAFAHLFTAMLERDSNEAWGGKHYVDYDLRWDRTPRPEGTPILLPILSNNVGGGCAVRQPEGAGE
ncbi:radical SAM protein [Streptomyces sp. PCS3-D2]|uniref:radical SAM protein n=1 Tax=Streptomyces sp. PCS3-D2 TaxID=1460244 RepID=UPI000450EA80|nr:radical SAM protein [Streptomyces sp. PCS3-D2]WKV74182.1 radical SAM protein [Streptomyces sp. PCS3-D2]